MASEHADHEYADHEHADHEHVDHEHVDHEHADHGQTAAYDDINIRSIALVGGVGSLLVFVAVVAVQVIYFRYNDAERQRKVLEVPTAAANAILADQRERISAAGELPDSGGTSIPIDEAMSLVVAEYQKRQAAGDESEESDEEPAAEGKATTDEAATGGR